MADLSQLGELRPVESIDLSDANYKDASAGFQLPKAGRYTVRAPETFSAEAFGRTNKGDLSISVDPTIVGGPHDGFKIRFAKVSARTFQRGGRTVSQAGDYLRATGFRGKLDSEAAIANACEGTANKVYTVDLDWRVWNKNTQTATEGMTNFPSDGNGGYQQWIEDPTDKDPETGEPKRLLANLQIKRFVAA